MDWDNLGPMPDENNTADDVAVARPISEALALPTLANPKSRALAIPKSRAARELPCPQNANYDERCLIASRMRDGKARKKGPTALVQFEVKLHGAFQTLRDAGLLRDRSKTKVRGSRSMGNTMIVVPSIAGVRVPYETIQSLTFSAVKRT